MARIIDVTSQGGELVIIGRALVPPTSNDEVVVGAEPIIGSIRYNPESKNVEFYAPLGNEFAWQTPNYDQQITDAVQRVGDTMTGSLLMDNAAQFLAANTTDDAPGYAFVSAPNTGMHTDANGALIFVANAVRLARGTETDFVVLGNLRSERFYGHTFVANAAILTQLTVNTSITAATFAANTANIANLHANTGNVADFYSNAANVANLYANTANIANLTAYAFDVVPEDDGDDLIAQIDLTAQGALWQVTHEADHSLTMRYQGNTAFTFWANGTIEGEYFTGGAASVAGADLAERYHADATYEPGTVVIIGGTAEITIADRFADPRLAGVISTKPGLCMNEAAGTDATHPYVALKGRVPCKVVGPIAKGDLLVSSPTPGHAQSSARAATPDHAVVGRALQEFPGNGTGIIEIKV